MIEYIKNIIPRIQRYSKELDKVENFIEKNWVFINENGSREEWILERDNKLIMTDSKGTKVGSWELTSTGHLLIKRSDTQYDKLENMFIEDALLVLKYSVKEKPPFILINDKIINDLDVVNYLERFEHKKSIEGIPLSEQKYRLLKDGEIYAPDAYIGKNFKAFDDIILNGTYKTTDRYNENSFEKYIVIENNKITKIYFHEKYNYNNQDLIIKVNDQYSLCKGDVIIKSSINNLPIEQKFKVLNKLGQYHTIKINTEYKIIMTQDEELILVFKFSLIAIFIAILFFIFLSINK